jgi:hypothetical protein
MSERSVRGRHWAFLLGLAFSWVALLGLAEAYLRFFPPRDLHEYLGEDSPLTGPFVPDGEFGVAYQSWAAFREANAERLQPYLPLRDHPDRRPIWAFFGNSFVHAEGMLADTARAALPERHIFNLGRNEQLFVRFAQVKLLLEHGLRPERLFVLLTPLDFVIVGRQPLETIRPTRRGALAYEPHHPSGPLGWLTRHSRTAFTAWVRGGWQRGNPDFRDATVCGRPDEPLLSDTRRLFASLARHTRAAGVPVTVLLAPGYVQVCGSAGFGLYDALAPMLRKQGFDVFDPRDAFLGAPDPAALFLPDRHYSELGNQLLLHELLRHLHYGTHAGATAEPHKT